MRQGRTIGSPLADGIAVLLSCIPASRIAQPQNKPTILPAGLHMKRRGNVLATLALTARHGGDTNSRIVIHEEKQGYL